MMTELFRDNRLLIGLVPHDMMEGVVELVKEQKARITYKQSICVSHVYLVISFH